MRSVLMASVAFSAGGVFMKPASGFTRVLPSVAVLACFLVGTVFLTLAVQRGNLSSTYMMGLGLEAVVTAGIGLLALHERLTLPQCAGLVLVIGGVVLMRS